MTIPLIGPAWTKLPDQHQRVTSSSLLVVVQKHIYYSYARVGTMEQKLLVTQEISAKYALAAGVWRLCLCWMIAGWSSQRVTLGHWVFSVDTLLAIEKSTQYHSEVIVITGTMRKLLGFGQMSTCLYWVELVILFIATKSGGHVPDDFPYLCHISQHHRPPNKSLLVLQKLPPSCDYSILQWMIAHRYLKWPKGVMIVVYHLLSSFNWHWWCPLVASMTVKYLASLDAIAATTLAALSSNVMVETRQVITHFNLAEASTG